MLEDRKAKTVLKVVHRNDRAQIKRVLAGSGQALLPMLELIEGAQASTANRLQLATSPELGAASSNCFDTETHC